MNDICERLREWGRWVRVRQHQGHCLSIEHRYRRHARPDDTPTGFEDWSSTPPTQTLPAVDAQAALEVEKVMRWIEPKHRRALKLHYVMRMGDKMICRRLVIRFADFDSFLSDAQQMVMNRLIRKGGTDAANLREMRNVV